MPKSFSNTNWGHPPAESPKLNPIERVWSHLKQYLIHNIRPTNKINEIKEFWKTKMTVVQWIRRHKSSILSPRSFDLIIDDCFTILGYDMMQVINVSCTSYSGIKRHDYQDITKVRTIHFRHVYSGDIVSPFCFLLNS